MKKSKEYVKELEKKYEVLRNEYLLQHGYTEKEVCENEEGGYIYRAVDGTYYKFVPVSASDEELDQILFLDKKCNSLKDYKYVAGLFKGFAIANFVIGLIGAFVIAVSVGVLTIFLTAFYLELVLSIILFGIAKIIEMIGER